MKETIVFDDWQYRTKGIIENIKKDYRLCFALLLVFLIASIIGLFFSIYIVFMLFLAIYANVALLFQYLKIKNNHLVITTDSIYVTNRFNNTKKYKVNYKDCILEIKKSVKRGGGIWMKFYDKNNTLLVKYEDMLNTPTMYGGKLLPWGEAIKSLEIQLIDKGNLYDLW